MLRALKQLCRAIGTSIHHWWTNWCNWIFGLEVRFVRTIQRLWFGLIKWSKQIRLHYLLQGLPAILALVSIFTASILAYHQRTNWVLEYEKQAQQAFHQRNPERARILYERLCRSFPSRNNYQFGLALALKHTNQPERAATLMSKLAPPDRQGYVPAHLFVAGELLKNQPLENKQVSQAEMHLLRVLQAEPSNSAAHLLLGQLHLRGGRRSQAETHLRAAEAAQPQALFLLVRLYAQQNRTKELDTVAERATRYLQDQLTAHFDDSGIRLALAEIYSLTNKHVESITLLQDGIRQKKDPALIQQLVQSYTRWIEDRNLNPSQQLAIIEQGLRIDSQSGPLLLKLAQITSMQGKEGDRARTLLQSLLARGQQSSTLYLCLGIDAQQRGKTAEATHYLHLAFERNSQMPIVANNLAYVLAHGKKPDLNRALKIIDEVVKRYPRDYRFRETRGQILVKMQRWKEALADLEPCVPHMTKNRSLHKALAETYRRLGMTEPAKVHERLTRH